MKKCNIVGKNDFNFYISNFKRKQIFGSGRDTSHRAHTRFKMAAFKMAAEVFGDKELTDGDD
jgi:hypothetical protein